MIKSYLTTPVEIYRDGKKVLDTKASVQKGQIFFDDVDVKELDIVKVIPTKDEFRIVDLHKQLHPFSNELIYVEAKVEKC
jgi:hypothetical protein